LGWKLISAVFFLPVWFQAIKGVSAVDSGIRLLPLMLSSVVAMILGGAINRKVGYYTALAIIGSCVMTIGSGLLYTLDVHSGKGKWIGYQIVYGLGSGFCFQTPNLAAQTVLPKRDAPVGLALMFFASMMGSAVFIAVGQNVLGNELVKRLAGLPGLDLGLLVTDSGATELLSSLPANLRETGLEEYNGALQQVFLIGLILSCLVIPGAAAMEWRSILHKPQEEVAAESNQENAEKKEETGGNSGERKTGSA
jgi:MFS family permease